MHIAQQTIIYDHLRGLVFQSVHKTCVNYIVTCVVLSFSVFIKLVTCFSNCVTCWDLCSASNRLFFSAVSSRFSRWSQSAEWSFIAMSSWVNWAALCCNSQWRSFTITIPTQCYCRHSRLRFKTWKTGQISYINSWCFIQIQFKCSTN